MKRRSRTTGVLRLAGLGLSAALLTSCSLGSAIVTSPPIASGGPTIPAASSEIPSATPAPTETPPPDSPPPTPPPTQAPQSPTATPRPTAGLACADSTLAKMTEAERVGQLLMIGLHGASLGAADMQAIDTAHIGSVWIFGNRTSGVASIASLARAVQARARTATHGVGFLFAADQEGGLVQRLAGPGFSTIPTARVQGTWSPAVLRTAAATWGRQLAAAGVNLDLAPVMDVVPPSMVATNEPIGQLQREFGTDPTTVAVHGDAVIAGMRSAGVATALKHFPGLGRVTANTDLSTGVVDHRTTPADPYLAPFASGIRAGARFVMVSLATYSRIDPDHLAAFSPTVIGLLRGELGFTGVVVSDSLTAAATSAIPVAERALDFVMAGGDLAIVDGDIVAGVMAAHLLEAAEHDTAVRERVDAAALRVLRAKEALGLLPCA